MTPENIIRIINITLCVPGIVASIVWMCYAHRIGRDWKAVFLYTLPCTLWLVNIILYTILLLIRPDGISTQAFLVWNNIIRTIAICTMSFFVLVDGFFWFQKTNNFHVLGKDN
jgi:hypothetical protein